MNPALNFVGSFQSGLGNAFEGIRLTFSIILICFMVLQVTLIVIGLINQRRRFRFLSAVVSVLFLFCAFFCFLPQVSLYACGSVLGALALTGLFLSLINTRM